MTIVDTEPRALRAILREFIVNVVDGEDEINQDELVAYATKRFADDDEFARAAARDVLPVVVPEVLRKVMHERKDSVVKTSTGYISKAKIEKTAREKLANIWEGSGSGYKCILAMRKPHLLALNERDEKQIETMSKWIGLRADLAEKLDAMQIVGDLPSSVLDSLWKKHIEPEQAE